MKFKCLKDIHFLKLPFMFKKGKIYHSEGETKDGILLISEHGYKIRYSKSELKNNFQELDQYYDTTTN